MKPKVKVLEVVSSKKETVSALHGAGDYLKGFSVTFEVLEGEGAFYAGTSLCVAMPGKVYSVFFSRADCEKEALYNLQKGVETVNYNVVKKTSSFRAVSKFGHGEWKEFDNEEDALEWARGVFSCVETTLTFN